MASHVEPPSAVRLASHSLHVVQGGDERAGVVGFAVTFRIEGRLGHVDEPAAFAGMKKTTLRERQTDFGMSIPGVIETGATDGTNSQECRQPCEVRQTVATRASHRLERRIHAENVFRTGPDEPDAT